MLVLNIFRHLIDKVMSFCITLSQYLSNPGLYDIVSNPSDSCTDCSLAQSTSKGSFFNLDFGGTQLRANSLPETLSIHVTNQRSESQMLTRSSGNYMMGVARRGSKKYNQGLNFYIDPDTISFTDSPWMRYDLLPSDLQNVFLAQGVDSFDVCFDISGARKMDITGKIYCDGQFNLAWEAEKQQSQSGYVQCGVCSGYCPPGYEKNSGEEHETCTPADYGVDDFVSQNMAEIQTQVSEYRDNFVFDLDKELKDYLSNSEKSLFEELGAIMGELRQQGSIP